MKYYTPELEEFHVGFEYEFYHPSKSWITCRFGEPDDWSLQDIQDEIEEQKVRVKYLDEQDIKDLGWELQGETPSPYTGKPIKTFKINNEIGFNTGSDYYLVLTENNRIEITVFEYSSYGGDKGNLFFTIKNKSELRKLMKQLGI